MANNTPPPWPQAGIDKTLQIYNDTGQIVPYYRTDAKTGQLISEQEVYKRAADQMGKGGISDPANWHLDRLKNDPYYLLATSGALNGMGSGGGMGMGGGKGGHNVQYENTSSTDLPLAMEHEGNNGSVQAIVNPVPPAPGQSVYDPKPGKGGQPYAYTPDVNLPPNTGATPSQNVSGTIVGTSPPVQQGKGGSAMQTTTLPAPATPAGTPATTGGTPSTAGTTAAPSTNTSGKGGNQGYTGGFTGLSGNSNMFNNFAASSGSSGSSSGTGLGSLLTGIGHH